jgi:hypothetical protein
MSSGRLLYLSKLNRPDAGALPCTANGATVTSVTAGTAPTAAPTAGSSASWSSPKMKSVSGTTPMSRATAS